MAIYTAVTLIFLGLCADASKRRRDAIHGAPKLISYYHGAFQCYIQKWCAPGEWVEMCDHDLRKLGGDGFVGKLKTHYKFGQKEYYEDDNGYFRFSRRLGDDHVAQIARLMALEIITKNDEDDYYHWERNLLADLQSRIPVVFTHAHGQWTEEHRELSHVKIALSHRPDKLSKRHQALRKRIEDRKPMEVFLVQYEREEEDRAKAPQEIGHLRREINKLNTKLRSNSIIVEAEKTTPDDTLDYLTRSKYRCGATLLTDEIEKCRQRIMVFNFSAFGWSEESLKNNEISFYEARGFGDNNPSIRMLDGIYAKTAQGDWRNIERNTHSLDKWHCHITGCDGFVSVTSNSLELTEADITSSNVQWKDPCGTQMERVKFTKLEEVPSAFRDLLKKVKLYEIAIKREDSEIAKKLKAIKTEPAIAEPVKRTTLSEESSAKKLDRMTRKSISPKSSEQNKNLRTRPNSPVRTPVKNTKLVKFIIKKINRLEKECPLYKLVNVIFDEIPQSTRDLHEYDISDLRDRVEEKKDDREWLNKKFMKLLDL